MIQPHSRHLEPHQKPVRFSRLKRMCVSPAHYYASFQEEQTDSPQKRFGRLVHAIALGGKFVTFNGERRGQKWLDFQVEHAGEEIVTRVELTKASRMGEALLRHADAMDLLRGAMREQELAFMLDGRACGARLDVIRGDDSVTDLKTTARSEPGWFVRNGARMGYHAQLSWYLMAATRALGRPHKAAYIVAIESAFPFVVTTFRLTDQAVEYGERLWRSWWEQLRVCEETNDWPAYTVCRGWFDVQPDVELDYGE